MSPDVLALLTSPDGQRRIAETAAALAAGTGELAVLSGLRRSYDADRAAAVLAQARLRPRAVAKLGERATGMLLLPDSLEQASRIEVARERAGRLVAAGVTALTDAGAGLGMDAITYAEAGIAVTAVEQDPAVAAMLRHNVAGLSVEVVEGDALDWLPSSGVVYFDPARRTDGRRIFDPERCFPPLSALVAAAGRGLTVVAKMSPSLNRGDVPPGWDADWVSTQTEHGRSVVEAVLWSPPLGAGIRRAKVLGGPAGPGAEIAAAGLSAAEADIEVGGVARYVYEPDGAVNQAGLVGELAGDLGAHLLQPRIAYLSGDRRVDTPLAHRYEVIETLPWSKRALARALSAYAASDLVIKKRGVSVDPTALRKELLPRLGSRAGEPLVVILTPHDGGTTAIVARAAP